MVDTGWKYVLRQLALILLVVLLGLAFLAIGLMIGYGIIGNGESPTAILSLDKWQALWAKFTG